MTLGEIIKNYRTTNNLSMDAFAERSGISKAYISLLEKNRHPKTGKPIAPSIQCIKQAAFGMNIEFNSLFEMVDGNVSLSDLPSSSVTSDISEAEYTLLCKYRTLDEYGKRNVDNILQNEYERCADSNIITLQESPASYKVHTLAAHEYAGATDEDKQHDYDLLEKIKKDGRGGKLE